MVVSERAQSNVTDITSGHQAAADRLRAGGRLRDWRVECGARQAEITPGLNDTITVRYHLCHLGRGLFQQQRLL